MTNEYDDLIRAACEQHMPGVDWRLFKAQLFQESRLDPKAISLKGAHGIAQFLDSTWGEQLVKMGRHETANPFDPQEAIPVAAFYMASLRKQWSSERPEIDRHCLALASYNCGLGNMLKAQQEQSGALLYSEILPGLKAVTGPINATETRHYVAKILGFWCGWVTG